MTELKVMAALAMRWQIALPCRKQTSQSRCYGCGSTARDTGIILQTRLDMNINLTPEQERIVKDELKAGRFRSAEEVIGEALQALRDKETPAVGGANGVQREAVREMIVFIEKNRVRLEGVTVKELIHEGHRL